MTQPFFSIIIPVYNAEKYIKNCVDSVCEQSRAEIILVDDGSLDNSLHILQSYAAQYSNIKVIHQENCGVALARIHGFREAVGRYVLFIDADDWMSEDALQTIYETVSNSSPDIVAFNYISEYTSYSKEQCGIQQSCVQDLKKKDVKWQDFALQYIWNKAWKREFLIKNEIMFDKEKSFGEDTIFLNEALQKADEMAYINKSLYHYREPEKHSLSGRYYEDMDSILEYIYHQHMQMIQQQPLFAELLNQTQYYENLCVHNIYNMYHNNSKMTYAQRLKKLDKYFSSTMYACVSGAHAENIGKKYLIACFRMKNKYLLDAGLEAYRTLRKVIRKYR